MEVSSNRSEPRPPCHLTLKPIESILEPERLCPTGNSVVPNSGVPQWEFKNDVSGSKDKHSKCKFDSLQNSSSKYPEQLGIKETFQYPYSTGTDFPFLSDSEMHNREMHIEGNYNYRPSFKQSCPEAQAGHSAFHPYNMDRFSIPQCPVSPSGKYPSQEMPIDPTTTYPPFEFETHASINPPCPSWELPLHGTPPHHENVYHHGGYGGPLQAPVRLPYDQEVEPYPNYVMMPVEERFSLEEPHIINGGNLGPYSPRDGCYYTSIDDRDPTLPHSVLTERRGEKVLQPYPPDPRSNPPLDAFRQRTPPMAFQTPNYGENIPPHFQADRFPQEGFETIPDDSSVLRSSSELQSEHFRDYLKQRSMLRTADLPETFLNSLPSFLPQKSFSPSQSQSPNNHQHTPNRHQHDSNNHQHDSNNHQHNSNHHQHDLNHHQHDSNHHQHISNHHQHDSNHHQHTSSHHQHDSNNHQHINNQTGHRNAYTRADHRLQELSAITDSELRGYLVEELQGHRSSIDHTLEGIQPQQPRAPMLNFIKHAVMKRIIKGQLGNPKIQFEDPIGQSGNPTIQFENPIGQFENPIGQSGDHKIQFEYPIGQSRDPNSKKDYCKKAKCSCRYRKFSSNSPHSPSSSSRVPPVPPQRPSIHKETETANNTSKTSKPHSLTPNRHPYAHRETTTTTAHKSNRLHSLPSKKRILSQIQQNVLLDHAYHKFYKEPNIPMEVLPRKYPHGSYPTKGPSEQPRVKGTTAPTLPNSSTLLSRAQQKRCSYCLNHGSAVLILGHKGKCPYKECKCKACEITRNRQLHAMREHRLLRDKRFLPEENTKRPIISGSIQ